MPPTRDEKKLQFFQDVKEGKVKPKTVTRTLSFYPKDLELLGWTAEYLGCSQSEAMRSAIRAFAIHLQSIARK